MLKCTAAWVSVENHETVGSGAVKLQSWPWSRPAPLRLF